MLSQVFDQFCSSNNLSEVQTSSTTNHHNQLPDNALEKFNLNSNTTRSSEHVYLHTSQKPQDFNSQSGSKLESPLKRSILYEHLLKDIPATSKSSHSTLSSLSENTFDSNNYLDNISKQTANHEFMKFNWEIGKYKYKSNRNDKKYNELKIGYDRKDNNDSIGIQDEELSPKIMNLSTKSASYVGDEDPSVPLNLTVKKITTPGSSGSSSGYGSGQSSNVPSKLLVNNLGSSNHNALANTLYNQQASLLPSQIFPQPKKRGRKPKSLQQNNDSLPYLNFPDFASLGANNFLTGAANLIGHNNTTKHATTTLSNLADADVSKPRKRGRPPTLSSPSHNSIQPLTTAHSRTSNHLPKSNVSGAFPSSYPFNLFNTPDVLSNPFAFSAAAAAAAAAASAGSPFTNSQNLFNLFSKLNPKDLNQFNLNLLNTNLFNLKNVLPQDNEFSNTSNNNNKTPKTERFQKEDTIQISPSRSTSDCNSIKGSFAHKPHSNEKQLRIPLNHGWKRLTYISYISKSGTIEGDVHYVAPCGKKIRNHPELIKYLTKNAITIMTRDNFSFDTNFIVGQFIENIQELGSEIMLSETQMRTQLEEINNKIRNFAAPFTSNSVNHTNSSFPEKKRRVRDSGNTRNMYDGVKNQSKQAAGSSRSIFEGNHPTFKNDSEPSITITLQNHSSRSLKRKALEPSKAEMLRAEKLLKKHEEEKRLLELKKAQERLELERKAKLEKERLQKLEQDRQEATSRLIAEIEQERSNQFQMFFHAIAEMIVNSEKVNQNDNLQQEKTHLQERKILKKCLEMELMKELKKPVEDMSLKDHKDLPTLNRIPGLKLTGKAFADTLMVIEFLYNFGETIGFDTDSLPNLNTLMNALLNIDKDAEEKLSSIMIHLVVCAIEDPGLPANVSTAMGQKLKDATVTNHNLTEILRLYFQSFDSVVYEKDRDNRVECNIFKELNKGIPFSAMNSTNKLSILVFICNELLCNQAIVKAIEDNIENVNTYKKDKWIIENDIRKLRVVKMRRERIAELENAKLRAADLVENNPEETNTSATNVSAVATTSAYSDTEENSSAVLVPPPITFEFEDDLNMTNEEIDKKVDKLTKQCNQMNNKLNKASNAYRVFPLGQDRFRRAYWVLPNSGGVFVEGMESAEPEELVNNVILPGEVVPMPGNFKNSNEDELAAQVSNEIDEPSKEHLKEDHEQQDESYPNENSMLDQNTNGDIDSGNESIDTETTSKNDFNLCWFELDPHICGQMRSEDDNMEDETKGDDDLDISQTSKDLEKLEIGLQTFFEEQTLKSLFAGIEKNVDIAILKATLLRIISAFPKSATITDFPNCEEVGDTEVIVCPTLQSRIQAWMELQYDFPLKIPREFQLGWWRITDPYQLKSLLEILHSNALRERNLFKHLERHIHFAMLSCRTSTANLEVNDFDREVSDIREHGAPTENICPHKSCHSRKYCIEVSFSKDLQVLEQIEAFEEKILACSMQARNWKTTSRPLSLDFRMKILPSTSLNKVKGSTPKGGSKNRRSRIAEPVKEAFDNDSSGDENSCCPSDSDSINGSNCNDGGYVFEDDLLKIQREKLLEVEGGIERRYLKPPLAFKNSNMVVNCVNSDQPNGDDYSEYMSDENAPAGLLRWRDAVRDAKCSSQVAMCLHFLENCIAWDKSVMRASCQFCGSGENEAQLLLCDLCDKGYHMYCFKPKMEIVPSGDWFCFDCQNKNTIDRICIVCGKKGKLLNCDTCAKAFHPNCLDPPMTKPLKGRWICYLCQRKNKRNTINSSKSSIKKPPVISLSQAVEKDSEMTSTSAVNNHKENKRVSNGNAKEKSDKENPKSRKSKSKDDKDKEKEKSSKNQEVQLPVKTDAFCNEITFCRRLAEEMEKHESCWPFLEPVNTKHFPTYKKIIKKPIDFTIIKCKFDASSYQTKEDFAADIRLMFDNCVTFNEDESPVGQAGHNLRSFFESKWQEFFGSL